MGNVRIKFDRKNLDNIAKQAVGEYAKRHSHECAYCHKPIDPPADMPAGRAARVRGLRKIQRTSLTRYRRRCRICR